MPNYQYVADSGNFKPLTLQEMLVPFTMYKDAYEKSEAAYNDLMKENNVLSYLGEKFNENPESKAAQIYNGYMGDLSKYSEDLAKNGLSMRNRRGLTSLKRRYEGEIGRLKTAHDAMEEERNRRLTSKDNSLLYATDNLDIDDFLDSNTPNLYKISGNDLYTKGNVLGKATSSRMYSAGDAGSVLNGYYKNWKETKGVSQDSIAEFMNSDAVQQEVDNILKSEGVYDNLSGANLDRARQQVLSGIYSGIVYEESNKPVRNEGVLTAAQAVSDRRDRERMELTAKQNGYELKNGHWEFNPELLKERYEAIGTDQYEQDGYKWSMGPDNKWHRTKITNDGSTKTKTEKPPTDPKVWFDQDGNMGQIGGQGYQFGKKMDDYNKVLEKYPSMIDFDPNKYDFYEVQSNGKWKIHPKPKRDYSTESSDTPTVNPLTISDDGDDTTDV